MLQKKKKDAKKFFYSSSIDIKGAGTELSCHRSLNIYTTKNCLLHLS